MAKSIERRKIDKVYTALKILPTDRTYRILVRHGTFQPVGLITLREYLNDASIGRNRDWAVGITFDKRIFREPLDMINQRTHELKPCIVAQNGFFIFTARQSDDPGNDDDNFQWYVGPDEMNSWHELNDLIKTKDRMLSAQNDTIVNLTQEKDRYYNESVRLGSHNRNLTAQTQRLSEQVSNANTKLLLMETQVAKTGEMQAELTSMLIESFKTAAERGKVKAMNVEDIVDDALKKASERQADMMAFASPEELYKQLQRVDDRISNLERSSTATTEGVQES